MIKKSIVVTVIFVFSTILQLVNQIFVTRIFGAVLDLDIFLASVAIPTIIVTVIYGTLNDAFLPYFTKKQKKYGDDSDKYFFSYVIQLTFISLIVAWLLGFITQPISSMLYSSRGDSFVKNVSIQMYFMLFSLPLSVTATLLGAYYYSHKNFIRFPLAQVIASLANLALLALLAPALGIWSLTLCFIANILIQIIFLIPRTVISFRLQAINILPLLSAWIPLIIGNIALRADTVLMRSLAADLPEGYIVYINLIYKIFTLATGIMTIGIQTLLLPHLLEYISHREYEKMQRTVYKSKVAAILISLLVVITLVGLGPFIIRMLFVGGKFTGKDAKVVISLMPFFILPGLGYGIYNLFFQPLIAINKQLHLAVVNVFSLACSWILSFWIKEKAGPLVGISFGLTFLLFFGIIGSELLWQHYKKTLPSDQFKSPSLLQPTEDPNLHLS